MLTRSPDSSAPVKNPRAVSKLGLPASFLAHTPLQQAQIAHRRRRLRIAGALSAPSPVPPTKLSALSQQTQLAFDDLYEYYDPDENPLPQRQQQNPNPPTPLSQRPPSSASSSEVRALRRTPRLQERKAAVDRQATTGVRTPQVKSSRLTPSRSATSSGPVRKPKGRTVRSRSTTPQSAILESLSDDSDWPTTTVRVSRRTYEAVVFALEAILTAGGSVNVRKLSPDLEEEEARMSDLYAGAPPGTFTGRPQDVQPPSMEAATPARITTPRDIMAARARKAREAEQEAARQQQTQPEGPQRRRAENVVGVGADLNTRTQPNGRSQIPEIPLPAGQSVTIGGRPNIPATNGTFNRSGATAVNQGQPRPVVTQPQAEEPAYGSRVQRDRTEAYEKLSMPAVAGAKVPPPQAAPAVSAQPTGRTDFPQAFERWEMLSARFEGVTGYWISKLEQNTLEVQNNTKPLDKQMSRQFADLSQAGTNLFLAVVELQKLRASSERKFRRWFFETRTQIEQGEDKVIELEKRLQAERQTRTTSGPAVEAAMAEREHADEMVREMRRELQISKEEARRAWEELGRREQEERERTIALRNGEPTLIGGVQVVPMSGMASRQNTSLQRPQTRDGPYPGGPGPTYMSGQQPYPVSRSQTTLDSPTQEQAQFTYQPDTTSPTGTDPFLETTRGAGQGQTLRHEPDTQFYQSTTPRTQPPSSAAAMTAAQSATSSAQSPPSAVGRQRTGTMGTDVSGAPSYIPSTQSGGNSSIGEEEYHINPDGSYTRDAQGRRIPYRQQIGGYDEISDDEDHTADIQREDLLQQQFQQRQQPLPRTTNGNDPTPIYSSPPQTTLTVPAGTGLGSSSPYEPHSSSTISPRTPQMVQRRQPQTQSPSAGSAEYEGQGYGSDGDDTTAVESSGGNLHPTGWEGITGTPRHRHPTRLSDIAEERTSPSRGSYVRSDDGRQALGGASDVSGAGRTGPSRR